MIKKYRKKPVVIEAIYHNDIDERRNVCRWIVSEGGRAECYRDGEIEIETLEGKMAANLGDYIIKGIKGEFYPCKPDIFEASYDEI